MSAYIRQIVVASAIAAVLVIGIGVGVYYATTTGNSSIRQQAGDQTIAATYFSNLTMTTVTKTIPQRNGGSSYTYSPTTPLKIVSVQAFTSQSGSGNQTLSFSVEFENIGSSTIYVTSGGGSSLSANIISGPVSTVHDIAKCEIVSVMVPVGIGDNFTQSTPGCWSGYTYQLLQPGTVQVEFTLSWSSASSGGGVTEITAEFNLN
jgi:hypothetical protein